MLTQSRQWFRQPSEELPLGEVSLVIPRHGEQGPELYVKVGPVEHVIPLRPGMVANLLDFCAGVAGNKLREGRPGT